MRRCPPHLLDPAVAHVVEDVRASLRHSVRNKLGGVRNAAFYLRKKALATDLAKDPRVPQFFDIINDAVVETVALLESEPLPVTTPAPEADVGRALEELAGGLRREQGLQVVVEVAGRPTMPIDPVELQLATFFALDGVLDGCAARGGGTVLLVGRAEGAGGVVDIIDPGAALEAAPVSGGEALRVARRVLSRWRGDLDLGPGPAGGLRVTLRVPGAGDGP